MSVMTDKGSPSPRPTSIDYTRPIKAPPKTIVDATGKFQFGTYSGPTIANLLDAANPLGWLLPPPSQVNYLRLKEWQAFQLWNERFFVLTAIHNSKAIGLIQFIIYDLQTRKKYRYERRIPFWQLNIPNSLQQSECSYNEPDFSVAYYNRLNQGSIDIQAAIAPHRDEEGKSLPALEVHLTGLQYQGQPQVVCLPFGENRGVYTHKCLSPMEGTIKLGSELVHFSPNSACMIVDHHLGYYPMIMEYDWVTAARPGASPTSEDQLDRGLAGLNLTANQARFPEQNNENCLWAGGKWHPLPPVEFRRPHGVLGPWFIKDHHGMVDLTFRPVVQSDLKLNLLVVASDYHGPYGTLSGVIHVADHTCQIDHWFGMGEKFYLRA